MIPLIKHLCLLTCFTVLIGCAGNGHPRTGGGAANGISERSVRSHLEFLAGDSLNGRGSGTRDEWIAASYIASQMRRWGVEPLWGDSYVQDVEIERREVTTPPVLSVSGRALIDGKGMRVVRLSSATLSGPLQKYRKGTVVTSGAVLLLPETERPPAAATVAASIVLRKAVPPVAGSPAPETLTIEHIVGVPERATVDLEADAYAALTATQEGALVTLAADAKPAVIAHTWNAGGRLTGRSATHADEVILLTAHLDHLGTGDGSEKPTNGDTVYNGADDDASGCVAVLELADAIAKGHRPERTVLFVWFGSEEAGGFGASHFLNVPPVPLNSIVANLEFEMLGRPDKAVAEHTLWLTGYDRSSLGPALARQGARIVADPHPAENFFFRSDNIQLARRGVVAQTVSSFGLHTDYHRPSDEVKTIDLPHMTESIRSMVRPVLWLADSGFRPEWVPGKQP
jgi:Peptidase family M28